ncbi:MAG TPA: copper chaperone PCu(A)C [Caldimonas sp.]|nr:copper chaperone PCu(A)C [Caldimonas sp.]HEX4235053.1 copper chaperone PCu(A)C [Caldimonas sp.]
MNTIRNRTFAALRSWPLALAVVAGVAIAHDARVGEIAIEHPFAAPSIAGTTNGAAYFAALENAGSTADRLLGATTPVAARVELHTMAVDAQGVMRMREIDGIALAPHARIEMGPGSGMHLMLIGLKEPLREGRSFPMMLRFERAGKVEVMVVVQGAKPAEGAPAPHKH